MWRTAAIFFFGAVTLSAQAPLRPTPQTPPRDTRPRPAAAAPLAAPATGVIRGRVVADGLSARPSIVKARVELAGGMAETEPVFTDSSGAFAFSGLAAGHYTLSAEKTGFARTRYGAKTEFDSALLIDLKPSAVENVEIAMAKGAAIFGRIVDDLGDPVVNARVSASVVRMEGTTERLQMTARLPAVTNDLGEYRLGGLAAGRYLLSVLAPGASSGAVTFITSPTDPGRRIGWGKTFYPAGNSTAGATPVDLGPGEERAGTDLTLVPFRPARLSMVVTSSTPDPPGSATAAEAVRTVVDPRTLQAQTTLDVRFLPASEPESFPGGMGIGSSAPPGTSRWTPPPVNIDPGDWVVIVRRGSARALAHITVSSGDDLSMPLTLVPGARLAGRVVFEGSTRRPSPASVPLDVVGSGPDANISPQMLAAGGPFTPKPDGTFEITGVIGTVEIVVADPLGWAVKSITAGDRDLLGASLRFEGTETMSGLEVVLTDEVSDLSGAIVDADSHPAHGCSVAVFPAATDAPFNARRMRVVPTNSFGAFIIDDLPPGPYVVVARNDINPLNWTAPASLNQLRVVGTPFTLASREKKTMSLPCMSTR